MYMYLFVLFLLLYNKYLSFILHLYLYLVYINGKYM